MTLNPFARFLVALVVVVTATCATAAIFAAGIVLAPHFALLFALLATIVFALSLMAANRLLF